MAPALTDSSIEPRQTVFSGANDLAQQQTQSSEPVLDRADPTATIKDVSELAQDARWNLAARMAASGGFARSAFLKGFLLYVCEKELLGLSSEITEQQIGVRVFGRAVGYNPSEDNIVRNYARMLRQRIDAYFAAEGSREVIRLEVPRGGYVPRFLVQRAAGGAFAPDEQTPPRAMPALVPAAGEDEIAPDRIRSSRAVVAAESGPQIDVVHTEADPATGPSPVDLVVGSGVPYWAASSNPANRARDAVEDLVTETAAPGIVTPAPRVLPLVMLLALIAVVALATAAWHSSVPRGNAETRQRFWRVFFNDDRQTILVPSDHELSLAVDRTHRLVSLREYLQAADRRRAVSAGRDPEASAVQIQDDDKLGDSTGIEDMEIANALAQATKVAPLHYRVRAARSLRDDDLGKSNVILLGSAVSDPWIAALQAPLNFQLRYDERDGSLAVQNRQPLPGESTTYESRRGSTARSFGLVAGRSNLAGGGYLLLLEGTDAAGNRAAADYLFSNASLPLMRDAVRPDGSLRPFEVLVEATSTNAESPRFHLLATRVMHRASHP